MKTYTERLGEILDKVRDLCQTMDASDPSDRALSDACELLAGAIILQNQRIVELGAVIQDQDKRIADLERKGQS